MNGNLNFHNRCVIHIRRLLRTAKTVMVACHRVLRYSVEIADEGLGCMFWFELPRKFIDGITS